MWFPNRSDTNQAVQSQKQARSLKFWRSRGGIVLYEEAEAVSLFLGFMIPASAKGSRNQWAIIMRWLS